MNLNFHQTVRLIDVLRTIPKDERLEFLATISGRTYLLDNTGGSAGGGY